MKNVGQISGVVRLQSLELFVFPTNISSYFPWTSVKLPIQAKIWSKCVNYEIEKEAPVSIPVTDSSNQE